jgi:hypothetical protein
MHMRPRLPSRASAAISPKPSAFCRRLNFACQALRFARESHI